MARALRCYLAHKLDALPMELPSTVALSYLVAQSRAMDVTATNLANTGTPGFKSGHMLFSDWMGRAPGVGGADRTAFVQDRATWRDNAPGTLTHTGNPLDLAIGGDGFFTVDTPRGPRLTRAGRFSPQPDGTVTDSTGSALLDTGGQPIRIGPADTVLTVSADGALQSENGPLGRIGVVQPDDPMRLQPEGATAFRSDSATAPIAQPRVIQGAVEDSNLQPVIEVTRMMAGLRAFQFASQFIESEATRLQGAIDKLTQQKG